MSASGFTPNPSVASSSSPATSSSHQPPTKSLRAMDETESEDTPAKVLAESTDDDLQEAVAQPVPNVPEEELKEEAHEGEHHEADDFVPRQDREATLEGSLPEMFTIGVDDEETAKEEEVRLNEHSCVEASVVPEGRRLNEHSCVEASVVPEGRRLNKHSCVEASETTPVPKKEEGNSGTPTIELEGPQPAPFKLNVLSQSSLSGSASARARSVPTSRSDDFGLCQFLKQRKTYQTSSKNHIRTNSDKI